MKNDFPPLTFNCEVGTIKLMFWHVGLDVRWQFNNFYQPTQDEEIVELVTTLKGGPKFVAHRSSISVTKGSEFSLINCSDSVSMSKGNPVVISNEQLNEVITIVEDFINTRIEQIMQNYELYGSSL